MIGREGHDVRWLWERHLVVPVKKIGAESGNGAAVVEGRRPESPYMVSARKLLFIHEAEWAGEGCRECDAAGSQALSEPFGEEFQHIAAPGKSSSFFCPLAGGK